VFETDEAHSAFLAAFHSAKGAVEPTEDNPSGTPAVDATVVVVSFTPKG
jgi:hypothetical protein